MKAIFHSGDSFAGGTLPTVADRPPAARRWLEAAIQPAAVPTGDYPSPTRLHLRGSICRAPGGRWMDWEVVDRRGHAERRPHEPACSAIRTITRKVSL